MRGSLGRRPGCCVAFHVCESILVGHGIKLTILCFSLLRSSLGHLWEAGQAPGVRAGGTGSGALASDPQAAAAFLAWGIQAPLQLEGVSLLRVHSSPCSLRPEVASCAPTAPPRGWRGHSCVAQGAGAGGRGAPGVGAEEVGCVTESRAASCPGSRRWPVNSKTRRSACTGCTSFVPGGLGHQQRQRPDSVTERGPRPRTALCP